MKINTKIFIQFSAVFIGAMLAIALLVYAHENNSRKQQIKKELSIYAENIHLLLQQKHINDSAFIEILNNLQLQRALRTTILQENGEILFDTKLVGTIENHSNREEFQEALQQGQASTIRISGSINDKLYYYAQHFPPYVIRIALPYRVTLLNSIERNNTLFYCMAAILLLTIATLYILSEKFSRNIKGKENSLKEQLTLNISHELKTPVTSILGYTESILNNPTIGEEKRTFFLERLHKQTLRLKTLLDDISILNRLSQQQDVYELITVDLAEIINNVVNDAQIQINAAHALINKEFPATMPIEGNPSLLYSIFRNMLDNSLAYGGENVIIRITCFHTDNKQYYFTFTDNGPGVGEEHLTHLFERFYRIDKGRSRKLGGTGLGLAIVKHAVKFHGGNITAENRPHGGLGFMFYLRKNQANH